MRMLFAATSTHPMIVLEFRHVSMRLCYRAGEVDHAAHAVAAIVQQQGFKEACIVGHSFGTFVASRLCQLHPSLVQSLVSQLWVVRLCYYQDTYYVITVINIARICTRLTPPACSLCFSFLSQLAAK